jgi:hemin uptake protein HemP
MDKQITFVPADEKLRRVCAGDLSAIPSEWLFSKGDEVLISHHGEQYRLRRTRNGKLILTK